MLLKGILRFLHRAVKPLPPTLFCAACGEEIRGEPRFTFEGKVYCEYLHIPTVRRYAAEELVREADALKRAREAGV